MAIGVEAIIFYLVLLDSVLGNIFVWLFPKKMKKMLGGFAKHLPPTKAWMLIYLVLVLWVGFALNRLGILGL